MHFVLIPGECKVNFDSKVYHKSRIENLVYLTRCFVKECFTRRSAMAEGPRDALVSRNSATTKHPI